MTTARNKMMDLLARRDHSEKELRQKLKERDFSPEQIDTALEYAAQNGWLRPPAELSEKVAEELHRKLKGIIFINNYLEEKGLPKVAQDPEVELEKARTIMKNKLGGETSEFNDLQKIGRALQARGFTSDIIRKVIYEK